jgi:hypothetical protein
MKKLVLGLGVLAMLYSCQSKEEKLIGSGEDFLISHLNDPKSYEKMDVKIIDTITDLDRAESNIKFDKENVDFYKMLEPVTSPYQSNSEIQKEHLKYLENIKDAEKRLKDAIAEKKQLESKPRTVSSIDIIYQYRAKNAMGALIIGKDTLRYYTDPKTYSKQNTEHWQINDLYKY